MRAREGWTDNTPYRKRQSPQRYPHSLTNLCPRILPQAGIRQQHPPPTSATLEGSQGGTDLRKSRATRPKSRLPLEEKEGREREEADQEEGDLDTEPLEPPAEEPVGIRPPETPESPELPDLLDDKSLLKAILTKDPVNHVCRNPPEDLGIFLTAEEWENAALNGFLSDCGDGVYLQPLPPPVQKLA